MKERNDRMALSSLAFAVIAVVILIAVSGAGYSLYAARAPTGLNAAGLNSTSLNSTGSMSTMASCGCETTTSVVNSVTTASSSASSTLYRTPGFYNSSVVTFTYPKNYNCVPNLTSFFPNQTAAAQLTACVGGVGNSTAEAGAVPLWVIVPAFAGLSIFGVPALGASADGFPTFNNATLVTQCGASGTPAGCPAHPLYMYSPLFTAVEQHLNITNGYGGLPEGVLPIPSHDHLINCCFQTIPWYTIVVLDFDPNIFPNAVTGQCVQVVPSNLTNPTGNCLSNYSGLVSALTTNSNATTAVNANNSIWQTLGGPTTQIVVPGATTAANLSNANTNMFEHFTVNSTNPYLYYYNYSAPPATTSSVTTSTSTSTPIPTSTTSAQSVTSSSGAVNVVIPKGVGTDQSLNYEPSNITVVIGVNNTILWTDQDTIQHTVTSTSVPSGAQLFDSGTLTLGQTFEVTLTVPGTYSYFCEYHPLWMKGTITVIS